MREQAAEAAKTGGGGFGDGTSKPLKLSAVSTEGARGGPGGLGPLRPPTNVGMILDSQDVYEAALAPLRMAVERQEREANSLRGL